jgi:dihydropteroate synthase
MISAINKFDNETLTSYNIGSKKFSFNRTYVMGILNVTPDSFSDGGNYFNTNDAINYAVQMLNDGADIIDIGGESSRPGSLPVSAAEELRRILPVVEGLLQKFPEAVISVDTTKSDVAKHMLKLGVSMINDISGLTADPEMIDVIAKFNAAVVIMHMQGTPNTMQQNPYYDNVIEEVYNFLYSQSQKAKCSGIEKIFIDPGIGFGKGFEDNLNLITKLDKFNSLSYPVVIGLSRKSFIGKILDLKVEDRETATTIFNALAINNGAKIIRTHSVKPGAQTCALMNKVMTT